jgi:hypothetical protein
MDVSGNERAWMSMPSVTIAVSARDHAPKPACSASKPAGSAASVPGDPASTAPASEPASIGLSALLAQARSAQKQLATVPLPIANHNLPLIQKLFGG